jgi:hypothetical protein
MDLPVDSPAFAPALTAALSVLTLPRGREPDEVSVTFAADIALKSLYDPDRAAPVWAGCWRARPALKCAAVGSVRLIGRSEDEAVLRDAVLLMTAGGDPARPAGRVFWPTKGFQRENPPSPKAVAELDDLLGLAWDDRLTAAVDLAHDALQSGRRRRSPRRAWLLRACRRPDTEPLAWALAGMLIATLLKWDFAVPLLMAERYGPAFKTLGGRGRVCPGEPAFLRAVCLALVEGTSAALRTAGDIARRAETLRTVGPKRSGRNAPARSSKRCLTDAAAASAPATRFRAGRRPGCSTGWRDLASCVNCPAAARSGFMGCVDARIRGTP